jgi:hypothetical protein
VRRGFVRRLPRPIRWLWYAILAVIAAELAGLALGLVRGDAWLWAAMQMSSILVGPLALGLLVVAIAGIRANRGAVRAEVGAQPARPAPSPPVAPELAAARLTSQAVIALARSREGKVAIRQTARLLRAVRAAAQPPPGPTGPDERERPPTSE